MLRQALWVGIGGFLGAHARVLIVDPGHRPAGVLIPYGTLIVNLSGWFFLGLREPWAEAVASAY